MTFKLALIIFSLTFTAFTLSNEKETVINILKGVVEGLAEESPFDVHTLEECIKDSEIVIQDLASAVQLIKSGTLTNVQSGIRLIGESLSVLPDAMQRCHGGESELVHVAQLLRGLLSELRYPYEFTFVIGKNLCVNGVEIFHEITSAVQDWDVGNYEDFGREIGKILFQLLEKSTVNAAVYSEPNQVALMVFDGVLRGFAAEGGIRAEDVQSCFSKTSLIVNKFIGSVEDFEFNREIKIRNGLKLLANGLQALPDAILACKASMKEAVILANKLNMVIEELENPLEFSYHIDKDLIINGRDIYKEIKTSITDWRSQNYSDYGYQIGCVLSDLFIGMDSQLQFLQATGFDDIAKAVFLGLLKGFGQEDVIQIQDIYPCIHDPMFIVHKFQKSVDEFQSDKTSYIINALRQLAQGLYKLPDSILECLPKDLEAVELANRLTLVLRVLLKPGQIVYNPGKDLIINNRNIYNETYASVSDWKGQDYNDFGVCVGDILFKFRD